MNKNEAMFLSDAVCGEPMDEPTVEELCECMRAYSEIARPSSLSQLLKACADRMERMDLALSEKQENAYADLVRENENLKAKYGIMSELYHKLLDKLCSVLS